MRFREEGVWAKASGKVEADKVEQVRVKGSVLRAEPKKAAGMAMVTIVTREARQVCWLWGRGPQEGIEQAQRTLFTSVLARGEGGWQSSLAAGGGGWGPGRFQNRPSQGCPLSGLLQRPMGKPGWPRLEEESDPVSSRERGRAVAVPRESPGLKLGAGGS